MGLCQLQPCLNLEDGDSLVSSLLFLSLSLRKEEEDRGGGTKDEGLGFEMTLVDTRKAGGMEEMHRRDRMVLIK